MKKIIAAVSAFVLCAGMVLPVFAHGIDKSVDNSKQTISINADGSAVLQGTLKTVANSTLTIASWGGDWTVTTNTDTKFFSNFDVALALVDMKVGDTVRVHGTTQAGVTLTISANSVKDLSIPIRAVTIEGKIKSITDSTLVVDTKRGSFTAVLTPATVISLNKNKLGTAADLKVGMKVVVRGTFAENDAKLITAISVKILTKKQNENRHND